MRAAGHAFRLSIAALLPALLPACSTVDPVRERIPGLEKHMTAETVASQSEPEFDAYRQTLTLRGPSLSESIGDERDGAYYRAHLIGSRARNGAERFDLYVATHLVGATANFKAAHDQERIRLPVAKVSRKKQCQGDDCAFYEHFAIRMTRAYLEARVRKGIRLSVEGARGSLAIVVPAAYVEGFMGRLQLELASRREGTGAPDARARVSYCQAKYGRDGQALQFCRQQTRASYERLSSVLERVRDDAFTPESKLMTRCLNRHTSPLGVDWMMVEHCYRKTRGAQRVGPASR